MVAQTGCMAPRKKKPEQPETKSTEQYRKPARMVRVRQRLATQGDILAERLDKPLTELVNDAFREYLERHGCWPPTKPPESS